MNALTIIIYITTFLVLLILSAFFSGSETAFFSLTDGDMEKIYRKNKFLYNFIKEKKNSILTTIVIGNNIVNILMAHKQGADFMVPMMEQSLSETCSKHCPKAYNRSFKKKKRK